jgi:hypothetical protein
LTGASLIVGCFAEQASACHLKTCNIPYLERGQPESSSAFFCISSRLNRRADVLWRLDVLWMARIVITDHHGASLQPPEKPWLHLTPKTI